MISKILKPESKMCIKEEKWFYKRNIYAKVKKIFKSYKSPEKNQYQLHGYG